MLNNPGISLQKVASFINYINYNYTGGKPMKQIEMQRTVIAEYKRIIETGELCGTKTKKVHTNPKLPSDVRSKLANQINGKLRKEQSLLAIKMVIGEMEIQGIKPTIAKVAEILKGRLGKATIERHWKNVIASQEQTSAPVATVCLTEEIEREFESLCTAQDGFKPLEYYMNNYDHDLASEMYKNQELITI